MIDRLIITLKGFYPTRSEAYHSAVAIEILDLLDENTEDVSGADTESEDLHAVRNSDVECINPTEENSACHRALGIMIETEKICSNCCSNRIVISYHPKGKYWCKDCDELF